MEIDPHTLQEILQRIHQQMRCPQCGKRVPVDFSSVQVVADQEMLLQLKCDVCNAYIVLQASFKDGEGAEEVLEGDKTANLSSNLQISQKEVGMVAKALEGSGGSFEKLFEEYVVKDTDENEEKSDEE